jgi:predicted dehydrogenase
MEDEIVKIVATAAIPSERAGITVKAMKHGKDVFVDKAPLISLEQLDEVKNTSVATGRKLFIFYSEFCSSESALYAKELIKRGVIGKVCHVNILSPHLLNAPSRPDWFFKRDKTGGILIDIGSHQFYQFLEFSGAKSAKIECARVANYTNVTSPLEFDDFGDATLTADNGVTGYLRVDWLSPKGLGTWGDSRVLIVGTDGYIELRKNCNVGYEMKINNVFVVTKDGSYHECVNGKVGVSYFHAILKDSIERTDTAMPTDLAFEAISIAIKAQNSALEKYSND